MRRIVSGIARTIMILFRTVGRSGPGEDRDGEKGGGGSAVEEGIGRETITLRTRAISRIMGSRVLGHPAGIEIEIEIADTALPRPRRHRRLEPGMVPRANESHSETVSFRHIKA